MSPKHNEIKSMSEFEYNTGVLLFWILQVNDLLEKYLPESSNPAKQSGLLSPRQTRKWPCDTGKMEEALEGRAEINS